MKHTLSNNDLTFKHQVESCAFPVADFDHPAHIRLAYVYLSDNTTDQAVIRVRDTLTGLLRYVGIDPAEKYHETLTEAWVLAVHHFMNKTDSATSADEFIEKNPMLLDTRIMMTHYSAEVLFSDEARQAFIQPNLDPIPTYAS